jgi:hypothetical protein
MYVFRLGQARHVAAVGWSSICLGLIAGNYSWLVSPVRRAKYTHVSTLFTLL